jgi:hypothetical protein
MKAYVTRVTSDKYWQHQDVVKNEIVKIIVAIVVRWRAGRRGVLEDLTGRMKNETLIAFVNGR